MSKLGRNDPCHCGSGKKFKKCHEPLEEAKAREERTLRTVAEWVDFHGRLLSDAVRGRAQAHPVYPAQVERFFAGAPPADPFAEPAFAQHVLFDLPVEEGVPFVQHAKPAEAGEPDPRLAALRDVLPSTHASLFEVVECKRGRSVKLADRLAGTETWVADAELSTKLDPLEVLHGRLVKLTDGAVLLGGWSKVAFRARKAVVRDLREKMAADGLDEADAEARVAWLRREASTVWRGARAPAPATAPVAEASPPA